MATIKYEVHMSGTLEHLTGDVELKPCPFCGSTDVELQNTHTASCWVECQGCNAQAHGLAFSGAKGKQTETHFKRAIKSAAGMWNSRY